MKSSKNLYKGVISASSTSRGVTTIFEDISAVVSVRNGVARHVQRSPAWSRVSNVDFVEGKTLNRVSIRERVSATEFKAAILIIPPGQRQIQCDSCSHKHRPTNKHCSATLRIKSHAKTVGALYARTSGENKGRWIATDKVFLRNSRTGTATYTKL